MSDSVLSRFGLPGRVAVVTGGGDGIGRAACHHMASAGAKVCVLDRDGDKAASVAREIAEKDGAARAFVADVTDEAAMTAVFDEIGNAFGGVDVLVNNAGLAIRSAAIDMPVEDWNRVLAVNLTGMFVAARLAARSMSASGKGGAIVNTASIMGLSGGLYPNVAYQTTKGGVVNMTRALALEWVSLKIRVNAVAPTFVRTPFIAPLLNDTEKMATIVTATPMGRIAEPEEVADAILFLASPAAAMITGTILPVDGGYLAR
ncbi:MAG: SDR family NAD(P)-dependent oxidoreductase [Rhizobiaceae bacterium]|jgi:NAD(P)-dependent dehydrogenase (short-subunit alcohol dehydrogenase family)